MTSLATWLNSFSESRLLCIGDVMLDLFIYGQVKRISPEAPIPIFKIQQSHQILGGTGNVIRNMVSLGASPYLISVVGHDNTGHEIDSLLQDLNPGKTQLIKDTARKSTLKQRFVAQHQQLLRVDDEVDTPINDLAQEKILSLVKDHLDKVDLVVLSDYGKGVLTTSICSQIIHLAQKQNKKVIVDPKGSDYSKYQGAYLVSPNLSELAQATNRELKSVQDIIDAAAYLQAEYHIQNILVTRSEDGMLLLDAKKQPHFIHSSAKEVFDVSGAGDSVLASLALALSLDTPLLQACEISNFAGGLAVEKVGTAAIGLEELRLKLVSHNDSDQVSGAQKIVQSEELKHILQTWHRHGYKIGFTNGCFDLIHPGHIHIISEAKKTCDKLIVGLNSDASVQRLKGQSRPIQNELSRACVLTALKDVDLVVIFSEDTPLELIKIIRPDILIKGADYQIHQVVGGDFVTSYGGKVHLIDLQEGHSTSNIVKKIA